MTGVHTITDGRLLSRSIAIIILNRVNIPMLHSYWLIGGKYANTLFARNERNISIVNNESHHELLFLL